MRKRMQIAALAVAALGLVLVTAPSLLRAHQEQQPQPGEAPQTMGQGMMGQGMMGQGTGQGTTGQQMQMMPGMESLMMPQMDPARGRKLFASKGCVACHSINGVGGHDATALDAHTMNQIMNPFDFAAKMWGMAPAMVQAQEEALGEQILFTGEELADIIAFVHDDEEQHHFSEADITPQVRKMMDHSHGSMMEGGAKTHDEELGEHHGDAEEEGHN